MGEKTEALPLPPKLNSSKRLVESRFDRVFRPELIDDVRTYRRKHRDTREAV